VAVLGRTLFASSERVDLPDLLSIDSFTIGDFKYLIKSLVGDDKPYILRGFEVLEPASAIGSQNISIKVADSVVYYPGSNAGPFYYGLPEGNESSQPLIPELRVNATNFVYLTFTTSDTAQDNRAFWDPDKNGGVGGEFNQNINTESVISMEVGVSVASFPENTIPVCKVVVGPSVISSIEDCRDLMFRLGSGGSTPDPFATFNFPSDPEAAYARLEPSTLMSNSADPDPFQGGDKNIHTLKEWMDVAMTKFQELGGTKYWYEDAGVSLADIMADSIGSTFKSKGTWTHDATTPGDITWSEDIVQKSVTDPREVIIRAASKSLDDEQVLYIDRIRDVDINTGPTAVDWTNAAVYVDGAVGSFENLAKGDWIKKKSDPAYYYLRVEEFYADVGAAGGATSAALAQSIRLSAAYAGTTETQYGMYTQGVYEAADVVVADRDDPALIAAGGDLLWLGMRSDTIMEVLSIATTTLACAITEADGTTAKITSAAHGLSDGERVTITGSGLGYNGTHVVEVEDANTFYITTAITGDESVSARYALVTTTARDNSYSLTLESANHGFSTNDKIVIDGTGLGYDSATPYSIAVRSATTFTIPVGSAIGAASAGTATLAKINTRTELGMANVIQGEVVSFGEIDTVNIQSFIGMNSVNETSPSYAVSPSYNTLDGQANYNGTTTDSLTQRVSKLTAMMADKAQDKTIQCLPSGYERIQNLTSAGDQLITFTALLGGTPRLDIILPTSDNNGYITLSGTLTLAANEVAYYEIDRNAAFNTVMSSLTVVDIEDLPLGENIFVFAYRLSTNDIWLWDGRRIAGSAVSVINVTHLEQQRITNQDRSLFLVGGGTWSRAGNLISWSDTAYIRVPDSVDTWCTIPAGNATLATADAIAYVTIQRQTYGAPLAVNTATQTTVLVTDNDLVIIAHKDPNGDIIINGDMALMDGESRQLRAGLSEETKTLLGDGIDEATSDPAYSGRGAALRMIEDDEGFADAIANIDAEVDKWFGQLQLEAHPSDGKRVVVTGAERIMRDNTTISKTIQDLLLDFDGAEIDFETGEIFADDGTTPLGEDFTPATIGAGLYRWYSISLVYDSITAENRVSPKLAVTIGLADGASADAAPRATFSSGIQLGSVVVQEDTGSIADIVQDDIIQINGQADTPYQEKIVDLWDIGAQPPSGAGSPSVNIDSVAVVNGYLVATGGTGGSTPVIVYRASGVGTSIVWTPVRFFNNNSFEASHGETVRIKFGTVYANQEIYVNATDDALINYPIRQHRLNSSAYVDYSIADQFTLADNTAVAAPIFSCATSGTGVGYRHFVIEYSVVRGSTQECGQIFLTTNGVTSAIATAGASFGGVTGITFSTDISATNVRLLYTSTSTGTAGTLKYHMRRWL
jgi:hypothetical protein